MVLFQLIQHGQFLMEIWVAEIDYDIWQLFVDYQEMVMFRWPNAFLKID